MENEIFTLKNEVERFAAKKNHKHTADEIVTDINNNTSLFNSYTTKDNFDTHIEQIASENNAGHIKVSTTIDDNEPANTTATISAIKNYITNILSNYINKNTIAKSESEIIEENKDNVIPTLKKVEEITNFKVLLNGIDLNDPIESSDNLSSITKPGYYKITDNEQSNPVANGTEPINSAPSFLQVIKQNNSYIQLLYPMETINDEDWFTGDIYIRYKAKDGWKGWKLLYKGKPKTETIPQEHLGENVPPNSISITENTAGFVIKWQQQTSDRSYTVCGAQYQYEPLCTFNLPIDGPYIFGNVIGRMDVKIDSSGMKIRTNLPQGGKIVEVNETYFIPRNG